MKPDSMIVEPGHIANAGQQVVEEGAEQSLARLAEAEPALASYLRHCLTAVAGKLALSGAPTEVVQGNHEEVLTAILVCLAALRQGHYDLWKDALDGTPLARLEEAPPPPTKPRRKKRGGEAGGK
jgi:hypothetical protein